MLEINLKNYGNAAILSLRGRVVRGETEALREAVESQADVAAVILDLAGVNMIDAGGLGLLLELRQRTQAKGVELGIRNVTRLVRQVLEITQLDAVFKIPAETAVPLVNLCGESSVLKRSPLVDRGIRCRRQNFSSLVCRSRGVHAS